MHIRETAGGDLLLQLKWSAGDQTAEFQSSVRKVFDSNADVRALTHTVTVEVKDLDDVTTKEEVLRALVDNLPEASDLSSTVVKTLSPPYGGTQVAIVSLPVTVVTNEVVGHR